MKLKQLRQKMVHHVHQLKYVVINKKKEYIDKYQSLKNTVSIRYWDYRCYLSMRLYPWYKPRDPQAIDPNLMGALREMTRMSVFKYREVGWLRDRFEGSYTLGYKHRGMVRYITDESRQDLFTFETLDKRVRQQMIDLMDRDMINNLIKALIPEQRIYDTADRVSGGRRVRVNLRKALKSLLRGSYDIR